jgi:hypothetical protein
MTESTSLPPETAPVALPTDTTPTWEIELLISGALAFASWQVPGFFDDLFTSWRPRLSPAANEFFIIVFLLGKSIGLVLSAMFALHILLRGLWAAALGLHSVYPEGVQWDRLKSGPYFKAEAQRVVVSLPRFIGRLDNAASIVFAVGGLLLMLTVVSGLITVAAIALTAGLARLFGANLSPFAPLGVMFIVLVLPVAGGSLIDRRYGHRWAPNSRGGRRLAALARLTSVLSLTRLGGPMLLVFTSRAGQVRGMIALVALLYVAFGVVLAQVARDFGDLQFEGYRYLADDGEEVVLPVHYADQRTGKGRWSMRPFVPSEVLTGGVVRLFVPWRIGTFDTVAVRRCGPSADSARTDADTAAQRRARRSVVHCMGSALDLRLDGVPVTADWSVATDGASDLRGVVAHLDARAISDGRHVLSVAWFPNPKARARPVTREELPFWLDRSGR